MKDHYIDFHTHTHLSDGDLSPRQLLDRAVAAGIRTMAITDHNRSFKELPEFQASYPTIHLIQGCEVSCLHPIRKEKDTELHVVALNFDPYCPSMEKILKQNQPNRRPYIEAILKELSRWNIFPGSYEELQARHPETTHLGRMTIAAAMVEKGYVSTVDEAFHLYIGAFGERKAFVPNPLTYVSLEEAVAAIQEAGGLPILAHLYYYPLEEKDQHKLLSDFREICRGDGGMEVNYGAYDQKRRAHLQELSAQYGLLASAGSDFHGQNPSDRLEHGFSAMDHMPLLERINAVPNQ